MDIKKLICGVLLVLQCQAAYAFLRTSMYLINGKQAGKYVGTVRFDDTIYGLLVTPHLKGLPPGVHGWQVYAGTSCADHGTVAGRHLDPLATRVHQGPFRGGGHIGDLPVLLVNNEGAAKLAMIAPRLKLDQIKSHVIIMQMGEDNYADIPEANGGGRYKLACGIIPYY